MHDLSPPMVSSEGYATREYIVFDPEWGLHVLNRIAEDPQRIFTAIADLS